MWLKLLGAAAILVFIVLVVAVLQSWSKTPASGRLIGVAFLVIRGRPAGLPDARWPAPLEGRRTACCIP